MDIRLPLITRAKLVLTERCQLRCKYCYESTSDKSMSLDTAKRIIDYIIGNSKIDNSIPKITFFGGEPLLVYEELMKPCIEYIRNELKSRCLIGFTTNGLLLDEEKLKYLKSMNVTFMLSIDGCKEAHDRCRVYPDEHGSFEDLSKNIPTILRYYPQTMARITLTPENLPHLYESVIYLRDVGFSDLHIIPNLFIGSGKSWRPEDFELARDQLSMIKDYIISTFEEDEVPIVFRTLADMFPRIVLAHHSQQTGHHRVAKCCQPDRRCGIGVLKNVVFDIEGNIFSCQHGSDISDTTNPLYLGDINTGVLEDRRLNLLDMNSRPISSESINCTNCPIYDVCTGGCVPNNYVVTGDFNIVPESYCLWTQELYNTAYDIIKYFDKNQDNMLFKDYFYGIVKRGVICVC